MVFTATINCSRKKFFYGKFGNLMKSMCPKVNTLIFDDCVEFVVSLRTLTFTSKAVIL